VWREKKKAAFSQSEILRKKKHVPEQKESLDLGGPDAARSGLEPPGGGVGKKKYVCKAKGESNSRGGMDRMSCGGKKELGGGKRRLLKILEKGPMKRISKKANNKKGKRGNERDHRTTL